MTKKEIVHHIKLLEKLERIKNRRKTGSQIAKELNVSNQTVSNCLRKGISKIIDEIKKNNPGKTNFEVIEILLEILDIKEENEIKKIMKMLPNKMKTKSLKSYLCINCFHCKIKNDKVYCSNGYFKNRSMKEVKTFVPFNLNCLEYSE